MIRICLLGRRAADGQKHTLRFEGSNAAAASVTNVHLDDVGISNFANSFE